MHSTFPARILTNQVRIFCFGIILLALSGSVLGQNPVNQRDGKLLRSELWQPFDAMTAKGDFFVSPKGNDSWTGTLAEPNAAKTDGPFATLDRAKKAVRELKSKVYLPK